MLREAFKVDVMNCQQFDQLVVDLARARIADGGMQEGALDHARSCPRCAVRLADQSKLSLALRAVRAAGGNEHAPARVEHALLSAFRAEFNASGPLNPVGAASPRRGGAAVWRAWMVATAAMVLLGLVVAWKLRPTLPVRPVERASSPQVTNKKAAEVAAVGNGETQPAAAVVRHAMPRSRWAAKHGTPLKLVATPEQTAATEATTRFYPLPYGSGLGLDEGWTLVRVQVRRSSLASLGVPVSAGSAAGEMLTADVVVGQDGLARGIRFVQ